MAIDVRGTPTFRRLGVEHAELFRRLTRPYLPFSDFNLLSLLSWNTTGEGEFAVVNGNLALKLPRYDGAGSFLTFVGTREVAKTARQLLAFAAECPDLGPVLSPVPEVVVRRGAGLRTRFAVAPAADDFDYVFGLEEMAALAGPEFQEKRADANRVLREAGAELRPLDLREAEGRGLALAIFDEWARVKGVAGLPQTANERVALGRLFDLAAAPGAVAAELIAVALFDGAGAPRGFCTAEVLDHGFAIGHFEKTDPALPGASALLRQRMARYLLARGCHYLNGEQDLGDPGLRTSKRSWKPRFFLRKYAIRRAGED